MEIFFSFDHMKSFLGIVADVIIAIQSKSKKLSEVVDTLQIAKMLLSRINKEDELLHKLCDIIYKNVRNIQILAIKINNSKFFFSSELKEIESLNQKLLLQLNTLAPALLVTDPHSRKMSTPVKFSVDCSSFEKDTPEWIFSNLEYDRDGVYKYKAGVFITYLWYTKIDDKWCWKPPNEHHWLPCTQLIVCCGEFKGEKPASVNQKFIDWLAETNPEPFFKY